MEFNKDEIWTKEKYNELIRYLFTFEDINYREFNKKIYNTKLPLIGVRVPILRKITNKISKTNILSFLSVSDSDYVEMLFIEGLLTTKLDNTLKDKIILYTLKVDTWALIDGVSSSIKINDKEEYLSFIDTLINNEYEFTIRLGILLLLNNYVSEEYLIIIFNYVKNNKCDKYYVKMAYSWLLCECYIKYKDKTYEFIKTIEDEFILRKTISKIRDSYKVSKSDKEYLIKNIFTRNG